MRQPATELHGEALRLLAETDLQMQSGCVAWYSLNPTRERARPLFEIGLDLFTPDVSPAVTTLLATCLRTITESMCISFPNNLLWDLDYLAASLLSCARAQDAAERYLQEASARITALQHLFGQQSAIRFRYVHDFLYGFDWAKWVARQPGERAATGPFDLPFLSYLERRGCELLALIRHDDATYPQLPSGQDRNPFAFSRAPQDELLLHRALARDGLIPVETWRLDSRPRWDRPYAELRHQRSLTLGLGG